MVLQIRNVRPYASDETSPTVNTILHWPGILEFLMRRENQSELTLKHCDHGRCQATVGEYVVSGGLSKQYTFSAHLSEIVDKAPRSGPLRTATVKGVTSHG